MPRAQPIRVHPIVIWPFSEAVRKLGMPLPALPLLLGNAGQTTDEPIAHERAAALLHAAVVVTGRDDLGVLAAEAVEPGHFDLVELASRAQRTLGEGLTTLASLVPILHEALRVKLVRGPATSRLRIWFEPALAMHAAGYDFIVASLAIAGRRQTRVPDLGPTRVRLPYPAPAGTPALARVIACALEFGAELLEIEFSSAQLDLPLVRANASVGSVLHEAARDLLGRTSAIGELERSVRERVREGLARGAIDAKTIARALHMSERTLRRRLEAERIGLRELVDDVRQQLALEKLADPQRSTEAIAEELGFTTAQAFHRAFRRWTGGTIAAHRARRRS